MQELEIRAAVHGAVCLPFQVVIAQCNLSKSGHDAGARTVDVIERVAGAAAELRDDASARNLLIAGHAVPYPEHHVREESVLREEGLARESPAHVERGEGPPPIVHGELGRAVPPHRHAGVVLLGIVVVGLPKVGEQPVEESGAVDGLAGRRTQRVVDVATLGSVVQQSRDPSGHEAPVAGIRLLADEHRDAVTVEHLPVIQCVRDRPARRTVIVLGDRVHRVRLGVFERRRREAGELTLEKVEGELAADRKGRHHGEAAKHIADPAVVGVAVEPARPRILEGIRVVAESRRLARREVAADVVDRHDGLHQDVLPDDVALAEGVVVETAVALIP